MLYNRRKQVGLTALHAVRGFLFPFTYKLLILDKALSAMIA